MACGCACGSAVARRAAFHAFEGVCQVWPRGVGNGNTVRHPGAAGLCCAYNEQPRASPSARRFHGATSKSSTPTCPAPCPTPPSRAPRHASPPTQVVHGTDTLAYTAAALSLMLSGFKKPIILTGGSRTEPLARCWESPVEPKRWWSLHVLGRGAANWRRFRTSCQGHALACPLDGGHHLGGVDCLEVLLLQFMLHMAHCGQLPIGRQACAVAHARRGRPKAICPPSPVPFFSGPVPYPMPLLPLVTCPRCSCGAPRQPAAPAGPTLRRASEPPRLHTGMGRSDSASTPRRPRCLLRPMPQRDLHAQHITPQHRVPHSPHSSACPMPELPPYFPTSPATQGHISDNFSTS